MGDRLTQLQDAVDQLAQQFVAALHFINRRHDLDMLSPNDKIRDVKQEPNQKEGEIIWLQTRSFLADAQLQLTPCPRTNFAPD